MKNSQPQVNFILVILSEVWFKISDNVADYYHKKLHLGRNLGLDAKLLLEDLPDGLPKQLK